MLFPGGMTSPVANTQATVIFLGGENIFDDHIAGGGG